MIAQTAIIWNVDNLCKLLHRNAVAVTICGIHHQKSIPQQQRSDTNLRSARRGSIPIKYDIVSRIIPDKRWLHINLPQLQTTKWTKYHTNKVPDVIKIS